MAVTDTYIGQVILEIVEPYRVRRYCCQFAIHPQSRLKSPAVMLL